MPLMIYLSWAENVGLLSWVKHGIAASLNGLRVRLIGKCCHHLVHVKYSRGNTNLMEGRREGGEEEGENHQYKHHIKDILTFVSHTLDTNCYRKNDQHYEILWPVPNPPTLTIHLIQQRQPTATHKHHTRHPPHHTQSRSLHNTKQQTNRELHGDWAEHIILYKYNNNINAYTVQLLSCSNSDKIVPWQLYIVSSL